MTAIIRHPVSDTRHPSPIKMKEGKAQQPKSLQLYVVLQAAALCGCWAWFAGLWTVAFFSFTFGDIELWLLVIAACAGFYGLRPNLERAIDTAWLRGITNTKALQERIAELRPIKRRIDVIFTLVVIALVIFFALLMVSGVLGIETQSGPRTV